MMHIPELGIWLQNSIHHIVYESTGAVLKLSSVVTHFEDRCRQNSASNSEKTNHIDIS